MPLFHGTRAGLQVGDILFPPVITGTRRIAALVEDPGKAGSQSSLYHVYCTTEFREAVYYSLLRGLGYYDEFGQVYVVEPLGALTPDLHSRAVPRHAYITSHARVVKAIWPSIGDVSAVLDKWLWFIAARCLTTPGGLGIAAQLVKKLRDYAREHPTKRRAPAAEPIKCERVYPSNEEALAKIRAMRQQARTSV